MVCKTETASFPSSSERLVACALLLLSSSSSEEKSKSLTPKRSESLRFSSDGSSNMDTSSQGESSESKTVTSPVVCDKRHAARFTDVKIKIVQKKRSKTICISSGQKMKSMKLKCDSVQASSECASEITTAETSSCFSSSSTAESSSTKTNANDKLEKPIIFGHLGHLAASIRRFLSDGSSTEVRIRQVLGDSPSTSKALRMLLKQEEVKRSGTGGRADPYTYMLA